MNADPSASAVASNDGPPFRTLAELERRTIEARVIAFDGNKTKAAKSLGISLKTLYNKLNAYRAAGA